jgi:dihydrofolate reductase
MISIIVARSLNGVIGKGGNLPWNLSGDLRHFAKLTKGHTVIMGRKTYESIMRRLGHALPDRKNIVITSQADFSAPGCLVVPSVTEVVKMFSQNPEEVFVIGGGQIYEQFLPIADKLYVTEVSVTCEGDTFFRFGKESWKIISSEPHGQDEKNSASFTFLELIRE